MLEKLADPALPYVVQLPKRPGQKEVRYAHLLSGTPDVNDYDEVEETGTRSTSGLETRVSQLENELAEVKEKLVRLMQELGVGE